MTDSPFPRVDVRSPKGPRRRHGDDLVGWAGQQLRIAASVLDNPGGGLLSATQAIGQVRASLLEEDGERFQELGEVLHRAEDLAVHRDFDGAREALADARARLTG